MVMPSERRFAVGWRGILGPMVRDVLSAELDLEYKPALGRVTRGAGDGVSLEALTPVRGGVFDWVVPWER